MIPVDSYGYAKPGNWHQRYLSSWKLAFPTNDDSDAGRFNDSGVWCSKTPAWDKWWFESFGAKPPRIREL